MSRSHGAIVCGAAALLATACIYVDAPNDAPDGGAVPAASTRDAGGDASAVTSSGGGSSSSGAPAPSAEAGIDASAGAPALVGVGYGGLRIVSKDRGATWLTGAVEHESGGDDEDLLRAVAWANGRWLAVGWRATTSTDGVTWTPMRAINREGGVAWSGAEACGLVEGLTSDGAAFYAACAEWEQPMHAYRSVDGEQWTDLGTIGDVGGHPALAHRDGVFYAYGDRGVSFRSSDGRSWSEDPLERATYCEGSWKSQADCHDASWFDGAYFKSEWQSKLLRSTNGNDFALVHDDPSNNALYQPRALAAGFVPR